MTPCPCSGARSTITFAAPVTLHRCLTCGAQSWRLAGEDVAPDVAFASLRGSFAAQRTRTPDRTHRSRPAAAPAPVPVVDLREEPALVVAATSQLERALAAVLAGKGLPGSWQLAG